MSINCLDHLCRAAVRLRVDARGSILPIVAGMIVVMIVIAGSAVDYSSAINQREKMAHALDAAALYVAAQLSNSVMTDAEIEEVSKLAFEANLKGNALAAGALEQLEILVNPDEGTVNLSTTIEVPTKFIMLGGIGPETLSVGVNTLVNYSKFDVELALVVDVTGSMSGDMGTLRTASEGLVDVLIPDGTDDSDSKVRISLVPYSEGVNLDMYASTVTNGVSSRCVTERMGTNKYTDVAYDWDIDRSADSFFGGGSTSCSSTSKLVPLTADRDKLVPAIRALNASGGTAGQTGTAWGWYTLSPNWSNLWPSASEPVAYDDEDTLKFAIIMTDGDNNRHYDYKESCNKKGKKCKWSWDADRDSGYNGDSSKRARQICENMKDEGITVYGVYFGSSNTSTGAKNMKACASDQATTYYQATSANQLINAFGNIAKKIQSIYLAQ